MNRARNPECFDLKIFSTLPENFSKIHLKIFYFKLDSIVIDEKFNADFEEDEQEDNETVKKESFRMDDGLFIKHIYMD